VDLYYCLVWCYSRSSIQRSLQKTLQKKEVFKQKMISLEVNIILLLLALSPLYIVGLQLLLLKLHDKYGVKSDV